MYRKKTLIKRIFLFTLKKKKEEKKAILNAIMFIMDTKYCTNNNLAVEYSSSIFLVFIFRPTSQF